MCLMCYRVNFNVKKGGQKTIKFSEGSGDVMRLRSAVGGLSVSIGPGLPKDSRMTSFVLTFNSYNNTAALLYYYYYYY